MDRKSIDRIATEQSGQRAFWKWLKGKRVRLPPR